MSIFINKIINLNCLDGIKDIPDNFVDMVMTSPPYWSLRDYGTSSWEGGDQTCNHVRDNKIKETCITGHREMKFLGVGDGIYKIICGKCGAKRIDKQLGLEEKFEEYIKKLCDIFDECRRVLKKTGTCWVNLGDTYSGSYQGAGKHTKERVKNRIRENLGSSGDYLKKYSHTLISKPPSAKTSVPNKSLCMIPFRFAIEMVNRGWILRNTIIWHKPNCMPSSVKDRFTVDFEYLFFFTKSKKYYFETQYEKHLTQENRIDGIVRQRILRYKGKYGSKESMKIWQKNEDSIHGKNAYNLLGRNKRSVWLIPTKPFNESHFAVYPEELCQVPIKAGCPEQGIVLDPFFGAGTTGLAALKLNRNFIGFELNKEYCEIAYNRLRPYLEQKKILEINI